MFTKIFPTLSFGWVWFDLAWNCVYEMFIACSKRKECAWYGNQVRSFWLLITAFANYSFFFSLLYKQYVALKIDHTAIAERRANNTHKKKKYKFAIFVYTISTWKKIAWFSYFYVIIIELFIHFICGIFFFLPLPSLLFSSLFLSFLFFFSLHFETYWRFCCYCYCYCCCCGGGAFQFCVIY